MTAADPPSLHYELPADALLVRGGLSAFEDVYKSAWLGEQTLGQPSLSSFGGDGLREEDIVSSVPVLANRPKYRVTTAGAMYDLGFEVQKTAGPFHYTIWLPDYSDETLIALIDAFGEVKLNPLVTSDVV